MGRQSSKISTSNNNSSEPELVERKRLKKAAFSNNLLSETPVDTHSSLAPSKTLLKHHGADILRKSQRKNRFLFSFPGLLAPIASGGKIGELKDLGTKNPILYLDFPQGQLKLFGTIVYPKNRYLSLQFSRGGKNVMCEDNFDNMIVFSEAWWIGTKQDNPDEARLDFPKQFLEGQQVECDFKGGAGAASASLIKQSVHRSGTKYVERESPETELESDSSDDKHNLKDLKETTPVRHSARNAGKTFKFTDFSSGESSGQNSVDSIANDVPMEEGEEEKKVKSITTSAIVLDFNNEDAVEGNNLSVHTQAPPKSETISKKLPESVVSAASKEDVYSNRTSLVQATISTLFNKVNVKKKGEEKSKRSSSSKSRSSKDSGQKLQHKDLKKTKDEANEPRRRGKVAEGKKSGRGIEEKKKVYEVEDDDIEEFSSSTQGTEESDEDWTA